MKTTIIVGLFDVGSNYISVHFGFYILAIFWFLIVTDLGSNPKCMQYKQVYWVQTFTILVSGWLFTIECLGFKPKKRMLYL